ncbi:uncharacterized protein LOC100214636 isoform X5 [Hydra vulgaris]|uniref:Uncharacterized protein LOC100214636 isoform X5 n=1 Tax=Hydra vulgaris TaxID=6087 RepID=A0ABM4B570_HYDVU
MLSKKVNMNWIVVFYILNWFINGALSAKESLNSLNELKELSLTVIKSEKKQKEKDNGVINTLSKVISVAESVKEKVDKIKIVEISNSSKEEIDVAFGVAKGLVSVIKGVRDKNFLNVVTGCLDIASSILMLTGPPGAIAGAIISLVSFGLSAFFVKEKKSQSQLILEGVEKIIKENEYLKLKEEIKSYFDILSESENQINEILINYTPDKQNSNPKDTEEFLKKKQGIFEEYDRKLTILKADVQNSFNSNDCLQSFSKMQFYFVASIRIEIFALHLIGLYELILPNKPSLIFKSEYDMVFGKIEKKNSDRQTILNYLLKQEKPQDVGKWKCVAEYYKYPGKFEFIDIFVKYSTKNIKPNTEFVVIVLNDNKFTKYSEFLIKENEVNKNVVLEDFGKSKIKSWITEIRWVFVPQIKSYKMTSDRIEIMGPTFIKVPKVKYEKLSIERSNELSGEYFRICQKNKMKGACFQIETKDLKSKQSIPMLFPAQSLYIPSGWKVDIHTSKKMFQGMKGPLMLEYICVENNIINQVSEKNEIISLSGFSVITPPQNEVKICSESNFSGWCDYIDTKFEENVLHSCKWKQINSFEIPKSLKMQVVWKKLKMKKETKEFILSSSNADISNIVSVNVLPRYDKKKKAKELHAQKVLNV